MTSLVIISNFSVNEYKRVVQLKLFGSKWLMHLQCMNEMQQVGRHSTFFLMQCSRDLFDHDLITDKQRTIEELYEQVQSLEVKLEQQERKAETYQPATLNIQQDSTTDWQQQVSPD